MKKFIFIVFIFIIVGCSSVNYRQKAEECNTLLDESKEINKWSLYYLDSLKQRTKYLESELEKCQNQNPH